MRKFLTLFLTLLLLLTAFVLPASASEQARESEPEVESGVCQPLYSSFNSGLSWEFGRMLLGRVRGFPMLHVRVRAIPAIMGIQIASVRVNTGVVRKRI